MRNDSLKLLIETATVEMGSLLTEMYVHICVYVYMYV